MGCPRLISNFCTPKIIWCQSDLTVVIRILLIDVPDYYLRVENDHLLFSTIINGKRCYFVLYLFGAVIAEKTIHKNVGREIKISLTKGLKWFKWLRLTSFKEKDLLITYDMDYISEIDHVKKNFFLYETVEDIKRQYNMKYIRPPTDDEESESDDENLDFLKYA